MQRDPQFGPFRIVRRLGVGGMAETFVAERSGPAGFEQRVCLKRVLPAFCEDLAFVAMFQNEARLAARLMHPHIAQIYDFGEVGQQWWMTLELIDGIDLRALLDAVRKLGQPMPLDLVLLIVADICAALAYAHEPSLGGRAGIVHRDVSPSNVLLSYDGAVKLADFGIAKPAGGDRATASGVKGKVPYMSPEQALGGAVDGRSDLFSLGVMAFEMLAERRPFDGLTDLATLSNLVAGTHPALSGLAPHAPAQLVSLVERLIAPDRDARPPSAGEVLDALSSISPPLNSRRVLGQLVRRVRPPETTPPPVDPTGPTIATPNPPGTGSVVGAPLPSVQQTTAPKATVPRATPPRAPTGHATVPKAALPQATVPKAALPQATVPQAALPQATVPQAALPQATVPKAPTRTPVVFSGQPAEASSRRPSRELIFALGSVALLLVLAASTGAIVLRGRTPTAGPDMRPATDARRQPVVSPPPRPALAPIAAIARVDAGVAPPTVIAPPATVPDAAVPDAAVFAPATPDAGALHAAPAPAASATRGTLVVTAYPWGLVEVDGRPLGRSPVRVELAAGAHSVLVRADDIVKRRTVLVTAGSRRELIVPVE